MGGIDTIHSKSRLKKREASRHRREPDDQKSKHACAKTVCN
jgi:hypothetical protein